jgi:IS1 family transposase/transposase-like protein
MKEKNFTRPPIESLACVNPECEMYGQRGQENLIIRKVYGQDQIRYLRCRHCGEEFSERKNTALWNSKIKEAKAISVAEHLAEGCAFKSTARLVRVDPATVRRLNGRLGRHGQQYHDQWVQNIEVEALQADERYGFAGNKQQPAWEAELIDPQSKFIVSHVQGRRNEELIRRLLTDGAARLRNRHNLAFFSDGEPSYRTLFPEIFGQPYQPTRQGPRGRRPQLRYRIPRTLALVQVIKHRQGQRLKNVEIRHVFGSRRRVAQALAVLRYLKANTSAIERRNGTARRMSAAQVRKTLAFARREDTKSALGWWAVTVYNWCRPHSSLRQPLPEPVGINRVHRPWPSV